MMSTATHPETDGQTERANRMIEDILRSYTTSFASECVPPITEFAMYNAVHASTGVTPFFINNYRHPNFPMLLVIPFYPIYLLLVGEGR